MHIHAEPTPENKSQATSTIAQTKSHTTTGQQFKDQRKETVQLQQLQNIANRHAAKQHKPIQRKPNKTGLPHNLKTGMENLSGMSLDHVRVHYNSPRPAQMQAHAYAQGNEIHLASGQEKHLPHELGHVVQQAQGRVAPTTKVNGLPVNDHPNLEKEADAMGNKALQLKSKGFKSQQLVITQRKSQDTRQRKVIQMRAEKGLRDMKHYYDNIQRRIPTAWRNRLEILEDVTAYNTQAQAWKKNREEAQLLWDQWVVAYTRSNAGLAFAYPGVLSTASTKMLNYFRDFDAVSSLLFENGIAEVKDALAHEHFLADGVSIPDIDNAFYSENEDENLFQFNARIRVHIMNYLRPNRATWLSVANYNADPTVISLAPIGVIGTHWTIYLNNLGNLNTLRVDDGGGNVNEDAINNSLVPNGSGNIGVHVSLEVDGVGNHKPRIFGRPASLGRVYNNHNRPTTVTWAAMATLLNNYNNVKVTQIQNWATARKNRVRANWEAH